MKYTLLAAGLGKSKQVQASLGKSAVMGNPGIQAIGSRVRQVLASLGKSGKSAATGNLGPQASLGKSAATGNPGIQAIGSRAKQV